MATKFKATAKAAALEAFEAGEDPGDFAEKLARRFDQPITAAVVRQWARRGNWKKRKPGAGHTEAIPKGAPRGGSVSDGSQLGSSEPGVDLDHYDPQDVRCSATERELIAILLKRNLRDLYRWADAGWVQKPGSSKLTVAQRVERTEGLLRKFGGTLPKRSRR